MPVHHDGQIKPAFPCAHVCDVGHPGVGWAVNGKTALQRIRSEKSGDASGVPRRVIAVERFDVIGLRHPSDSILATGLARFVQIEKDTRGTVDAVTRRIKIKRTGNLFSRRKTWDNERIAGFARSFEARLSV